MNNAFLLPIACLTPSQLYISEDKLDTVRAWYRGDPLTIAPIPVKRLAGRILMTDGHTRAAAALLSGADVLPCVWDTDNLDWAAYAADISICAEEGITSVAALAHRIVSGEDYSHLWNDRCDALYGEWQYRCLVQKEETVFFTREPVPCPVCDVRPVDLGYNDGEYFGLFADGVMTAFGSIERYSFAFWECASIRVEPSYRGRGFGFALSAWITNRIVTEGRTATCRTLPGNAGMNRIIGKCGYRKLYD